MTNLTNSTNLSNGVVETFFATTYSLQQARGRLRLLRDYLMNYFFRPKADQPLADKSDFDPQDPWLASLGENFYKNFDENNVYQKLRILEDTIDDIEPLTLYITFDIPEKEINRLGVWMRENIQTPLVFDIKIDPNIIAGCALSWKGRYKDYSLKAKIDENRDKILVNLKSFTR